MKNIDDYYIYLVITGGGSQVISKWHSQNTGWFLGAEIPNHIDVLGKLVWEEELLSSSYMLSKAIAQYALTDVINPKGYDKRVIGIGAVCKIYPLGSIEKSTVDIAMAYIIVNEKFNDEIMFLHECYDIKNSTIAQQETDCAAAIDFFVKENIGELYSVHN